MNKSPTFLRNRKTGKPVEAEICDEITDQHVRLWHSSWMPIVAKAETELQRRGIPRDRWPQDLHWKWDDKTAWSRKVWALKRYSLLCEGELQGLMLINLAKYSRLATQVGWHIAYVEFVATAPWNRPDLCDQPTFRGVGQTLMRTAVEVSRAESFRGRIGLHSLPQANEFYQKVCGMTDLGPDRSYDDLVYYEMTEAQADSFCAPPQA